MLNPSGLDSGARGFATQYGQQSGNAAFSLGNLAGALQAGGMQASQLGVRGGLAGLQAGTSTQQQIGQRLPSQALQTSLQQLGNYRQGGLPTNNGLANGMATAAGVRAGLGALTINNQGILRPGAVDARTAALGGLAFGQNASMQGAFQQSASLAAALGTQQAALNMQGMGRLGMANIQNAQRMQQAATGLGSSNVNLLQQQQQNQLGGGVGSGALPSQDLLAMIGRQKQQQQQQQVQVGPFNQLGLVGSGFGAVGGQQGLAGPMQDQEGPGPLDETNYPTLGGAGRQGGDQGFGAGGLALRKAIAGAAGSEFSIVHEEFPALGGPGGQRGMGQDDGRGQGYSTSATRGGFPMLGSMSSDQQQLAEQMLRGMGGGADYEQLLRYQQQQQQGRAAAATAGASLKVAGPSTNASAPDRYGLLGLMPLLKMADQDLTMLALGTDLTSLGLNLNSSESLHRSFMSPLADVPVKPEPEFELPACYKHTPQRLQPGYLAKFKEETLFYIFFSMPQDEGQLIAADELYTRGWVWHRRARLWMIAAPNTSTQKTQRGERGSYLVFDPSVWEVVPKPDVDVIYDDIEPHPRLPRPKHLAAGVTGTQQQQQVGQRH